MNGWVRFTDQEPEIGVRIIVYDPISARFGCGIAMGKYIEREHINRADIGHVIYRIVDCEACDSEYYSACGCSMTHWMYAPKPPEEEA